MSLMFNVVVLALWELNVGNIYADQQGRTPALPPAEGLLGPRRRSSAALAVGDPDLLAALAPHELEEVADRAARFQAYVMARSGDKKEDRFNGVLLVHTTQPEAAQRVIEELLELQARRWRLAEIVPAEAGRSTLEYLLRLRDEFLPTTLLDALKGRGTPPSTPPNTVRSAASRNARKSEASGVAARRCSVVVHRARGMWPREHGGRRPDGGAAGRTGGDRRHPLSHRGRGRAGRAARFGAGAHGAPGRRRLGEDRKST